jgi:hypothetical protein
VTYYFAATTYNASGQESSFSDEVPYTVPITTANPPVTNNVVIGQNIILKVLAAGTGQLNYEWQFNSTDISSATNGILTLNNITMDQAGTYSVTVSDDTGMTVNVTIYLAVYPTAAATLAPAMFTGGQFSLNISGVPGFGYVVQASTNLMDWESVQTNLAPFVFTDPDASQYSRRFYRTLAAKGINTRFTLDATTSAPVNHFRFVHPDVGQF